MRRLAVIGVVLFVCLAVSAIMFAQERGVSAGADRGKALYENYCGDCHGTSGKGDGPSARALGSAPTSFTESKFWEKDGETRIRTAVKDGYGAMPPLDLKKDEMNAIFGYMSRAFTK
jgi:mono/diheme cytochrome c family protein